MSDDLIREALEWAAKGVPVFPCADNKRPLTQNGFYDAVTDPAEVRALFEFYGGDAAMIGGRMGDGLFAVDVDLYKGDAPKDWLQERIDAGDMPETRVHETRSGGLHFLYEGDSNSCVPAEGVEVKGEGSYVILPGTPGYNVRSEGLAVAPPSLLTLIRSALTASRGSSEAQLKNNILSGRDFHDSLTKLAARWADRGENQETIQGKLLDLLDGSTARAPGHERHRRWLKVKADDGGELSRIAFSAYRKFNPESIHDEAGELGDDLIRKVREIENQLFSPVPEQKDEQAPITFDDDTWPFEGQGYFASEERDFTDTNFTMYPIMAENETVVLFAEPKTGKTALALTTALHISCGMDLGNFKVTEGGPCIYYALEGTRAIGLRIESWKRRMREKKVDIPEQIPLYVVEKATNFLKERSREAAAAQIIAANSYSIKTWGVPLKAIYLDTLTKAMSGGDQNSVEDTSSMFEIVNLIRDGGVKATIVFVHHKARQGHVRGSSNIEAEPDMLLDVAKVNDVIKLKVARARSIEDGMTYSFLIENVNLGKTKQGHDLSGMFVEPLDGVETEDENPAEVQLLAQRRKAITQLGVGAHTAEEVLEAWFMESLIKGRKVRGQQMPPNKTAAASQEALVKVAADVGGTVYGDFLIRPALEDGSVTGYTVLKATY